MKPLAVVAITITPISMLAGLGAALVLRDHRTSEFASYEEMQKSGIFQAGWLPAYFPRSAYEVLEHHNIDTNEVWANFRYQASSADPELEPCKLIAENAAGRKFLCPPIASRTSTFVLRRDGTGSYRSAADEI